jgi:hypothetical protein
MALGESPADVTSGAAGISGPDNGAGTAGHQPGAPAITSLSAFFTAVGAVGGQITLVTALLFYFGWSRTAAEAQYLGFDASALQLSTSDYVLRSVDTLFLPLSLLAAVLIGVQIAHPHVVSWCHNRMDRVPGWIRVAIPLAVVAFPLAGWIATRPAPEWWPLVMPLSVTAAVLLCLYIVLVAQVLKREPQPRRTVPRGTLAVALVVLCLFWSIGRFANVMGDTAAASFISSIKDQNAATVTVLSKYDLRISDLGVHTTRFGDGGMFGFEYQGLVLFTRSGGNFFLLPLGWTYEHPRVVVIPDNDEVRIYYVR